VFVASQVEDGEGEAMSATLGERLCEAVGIDPENILRFELSITGRDNCEGRPASVSVTKLLTTEEEGKLVKVLEEYELVRKDTGRAGQISAAT